MSLPQRVSVNPCYSSRSSHCFIYLYVGRSLSNSNSEICEEFENRRRFETISWIENLILSVESCSHQIFILVCSNFHRRAPLPVEFFVDTRARERACDRSRLRFFGEAILQAAASQPFFEQQQSRYPQQQEQQQQEDHWFEGTIRRRHHCSQGSTTSTTGSSDWTKTTQQSSLGREGDEQQQPEDEQQQTRIRRRRTTATVNWSNTKGKWQSNVCSRGSRGIFLRWRAHQALIALHQGRTRTRLSCSNNVLVSEHGENLMSYVFSTTAQLACCCYHVCLVYCVCYCLQTTMGYVGRIPLSMFSPFNPEKSHRLCFFRDHLVFHNHRDIRENLIHYVFPKTENKAFRENLTIYVFTEVSGGISPSVIFPRLFSI